MTNNRISYNSNKSGYCDIEVGVVEDTGRNSAEVIRRAKKWVYNGRAESVSGVSVKLDMTKKHLKIKATARQSKIQVSPSTFTQFTGRVFPYFSVNSTDFTLSLTQWRSTYF